MGHYENYVSEFSDTGGFIKRLHITEGKRIVSGETLSVELGAASEGTSGRSEQ